MGTKLIFLYQEKIKRNHKIAFWATIVIGMIAHLYKFTNTLPNHDALFNAYSSQNMVASGRWFLAVAAGFSSYFDLPWINGILAVLWIAITAVMIVDIFAIDNPILIILTGGLLVTFPAVTTTFTYEYTADGYMFAMLLSVLPVFLISRNWRKKRLLLSAAAVCLSCGIYQAYVSFGLMLALVYFMTGLLENKYTIKECRQWIWEHLLIYILGLISYFAIWNICMRLEGYQATSYKGINRIGRFTIKEIGGAFCKVFRSFGEFWVTGSNKYIVLNLFVAAALVFTMIYAVFASGLLRRIKQLGLFIACIFCIPIASFLWYLSSPGVTYREMMLQSLCILYIVMLIWLERWCPLLWKNVGALLLAVVVYYNSLCANICYYYMNRCYEESYALAVEMSTRIHMLDYGNAKSVVLVGNLNPYRNNNGLVPNSDYKISQLGYLDESLMDREMYAALFLSGIVGFELSYYNIKEHSVSELAMSEKAPVPKNVTFHFPMASEKQKQALLENNEVLEMGSWPAADSVKLIGDVIVIKLSEPDEQYEG